MDILYLTCRHRQHLTRKQHVPVTILDHFQPREQAGHHNIAGTLQRLHRRTVIPLTSAGQQEPMLFLRRAELAVQHQGESCNLGKLFRKACFGCRMGCAATDMLALLDDSRCNDRADGRGRGGEALCRCTLHLRRSVEMPELGKVSTVEHSAEIETCPAKSTYCRYDTVKVAYRTRRAHIDSGHTLAARIHHSQDAGPRFKYRIRAQSIRLDDTSNACDRDVRFCSMLPHKKQLRGRRLAFKEYALQAGKGRTDVKRR